MRILVGVWFVVLASNSAFATSFMPAPTMQELATKACAAAPVQINSINVETLGNQKTTKYSFSLAEGQAYFFGSEVVGTNQSFYIPGGGGTRVVGVPKFSVGDLIVAFLWSKTCQAPFTLYSWQEVSKLQLQNGQFVLDEGKRVGRRNAASGRSLGSEKTKTTLDEIRHNVNAHRAP